MHFLCIAVFSCEKESNSSVIDDVSYSNWQQLDQSQLV